MLTECKDQRRKKEENRKTTKTTIKREKKLPATPMPPKKRPANSIAFLSNPFDGSRPPATDRDGEGVAPDQHGEAKKGAHKISS